jgi:hypothetical protein
VGFLGRRGRPGRDHPAHAQALVVEATAPPERGPNISFGSRGRVRIFADLGSGRQTYDTEIRETEEHWLVLGMEVAVIFDPDHPERFQIDWESLPSMEARAASGDPALADPIATRRKVAHALGLTQAETGTFRTERFERALEQAGTHTAPPGKLRAVVLISTIRGRLQIGGDANDLSAPERITYKRASAAVLSVTVPGRSPYPVYARHFKCEVDLLEPLWMPLPALVSAGDPSDVEILWDEVPGHDAQLVDRIAGSRAAQQARAAQVDAFSAQTFPEPSQMQQLAADSAKRALQYVTDPAMRKMLIDQYRAAGIDVGEDP